MIELKKPIIRFIKELDLVVRLDASGVSVKATSDHGISAPGRGWQWLPPGGHEKS